MSEELITRLIAAFEKAAKAMRYGIFQASDKLAETLDGLCRAPDPSTVSVGAPVGEGTSEVAFPRPSEVRTYVVTEEVMEAIHLLHDAGITPQMYQLLNPEK